ncbi:ammonium transporter [Lacihabitans sp. LS3-19]|uniref:ammonium transporter n=1 Tax=Lacihabitans sp. LS3-19 TaxID=2487335 RepID=UPI0020CD96DB|nr:ammonium transporter [Lacihabitans sp. LS3-19]MCP9769810.1 ammonium transporter [Lacihabitans sp. LS3-19]
MEEISTSITEITNSINSLWVLIATCLVMFMQAGFALVEVGFTRAKNGANILMKNLLDYAVGSLAFWFIGYSIMFGEDMSGMMGKVTLFFGDDTMDGLPPYTTLMFQTVFAATAATIVSGAMAERTKFAAYLVYSVFITLIIYPVSGHWTWGGGWLSEMGFIDFAGSTVVHSVGGWAALVGAYLVGPRVGKFIKGKPVAIPGHNLVLGTLGVFILWLGWFGFNPGSQLAAVGKDNAIAVSHIFVTTNLAAAAGAVASMIISWFRYKKPSLSVTLNGALAGLVGITAGCAAVSAGSAVIIGVICGVVLVFALEFIEKFLKIDDPVGAISVHGVCGALGTLLVGVFATEGGLINGGGFAQLGVQAIGVFSTMGWVVVTSFVLFKAVQLTIGLRESDRVQEEGLDIYEHGETIYNNI